MGGSSGGGSGMGGEGGGVSTCVSRGGVDGTAREVGEQAKRRVEEVYFYSLAQQKCT